MHVSLFSALLFTVSFANEKSLSNPSTSVQRLQRQRPQEKSLQFLRRRLMRRLRKL